MTYKRLNRFYLTNIKARKKNYRNKVNHKPKFINEITN